MLQKQTEFTKHRSSEQIHIQHDMIAAAREYLHLQPVRFGNSSYPASHAHVQFPTGWKPLQMPWLLHSSAIWPAAHSSMSTLTKHQTDMQWSWTMPDYHLDRQAQHNGRVTWKAFIISQRPTGISTIQT